MRQLSGSDRIYGALSLSEILALLLWLMVGLQTLSGLATAASRVVTVGLPF